MAKEAQMKRIAAITAVMVLVAGLYGCGSKQGNAPVSSAQPLQTIQTGTSAPTSVEPSQPTDTSPDQTDDSSDPDVPQATQWPDPTSIAYSGNYLNVAQDADASKYPALDVSQQVDTCFGTLKIPAKWSVSDPQGTPTLVDDKGRSVGQLYQINAYLSQPYFSLYSKDDGTLMTWFENTSYQNTSNQLDDREFSLESDHPTALDSTKQKTIVKTVCLLDSEPNNDETGAEYYPAYCLSIDKAYINGSSVDYVISNKSIDEIVMSFADGLSTEQ
jgi:hypothetical protein